MTKKVAILGYHKIGPPPGDWYTWNYVPAKVFEEHLQYLRDSDWEVIDDKKFLMGLEQPEALPDKAALITFDDGYNSNLQIALPILQQFSYPAVVFVPTAFVGGYNAFDADIFYEPKENMCSWEELKKLEELGVSVQSHGVNHAHLSNLSIEELKFEIAHSKEALEKNLNKKIEAFSFPYGDMGVDRNKTERILAETGYKAAFLFAGNLIKDKIENRFRLDRIGIGPDTDLAEELKEK